MQDNFIKEKEDFQRLIIDHLVEDNGYIERIAQKSYNPGYAMDTELFFEFIKTTQGEEYNALKKIYKDDTDELILNVIAKDRNNNNMGLIYLLKNGIDIDMVHFTLLYNKPETDFNPELLKKYNSNIFSVMQEVYHKEGERIDLVLFVNGIAFITFELKSNASGQNVDDAIWQYKNERDCKTALLSYKSGALINFAMDLEQVYMCTKLNGLSSVFLPFNKGNGLNGKGNPEVEAGKLKVAYMWEDILKKDTLVYLIKRFIFIEKKEKENKITKRKSFNETLIFPRYHQLNAVRKVINDVKENHTQRNYLIEHSAGSGKTNTIAWLSYLLADTHDNDNNQIFDTIIVMTDRIIVDRQLQQTINYLSHKAGQLKVLDDSCTSNDLKDAINGNTKIIVTTIQKFRYILDGVKESGNKHFAILIDEAHSSTAGKNMKAVKEALTITSENESDEKTYEDLIDEEIQKSKKPENVSMIAFTATPTAKTLQMFGTLNKEGKVVAFDLYSMKQAIDEGFILNVLDNYITYKTYFKLNKTIEDDPKYNSLPAKRKISKIINENPQNISQKVAIIVEHFRNNVMNELDGQAKAMVVTGSRRAAVIYKKEFERYIEENGYNSIHALVAFTDKVTIEDEETGKKIDYTSIGMNTNNKGLPYGFTNEDDYIREVFDTDAYNVLLVADKFQTGFDQKKLCAMYVDKKLRGVAAVQTLSRLNRIYPPYDKRTVIIDFKNDYEDIKKAFSEWYEVTELVTSPNPENLRILERKIDEYGFLNYDDIIIFNSFVYQKKRTSRDKEKMQAYIQKSKDIIKSRKIDEQVAIKKTIVAFIKLYDFVLQTTSFEDEDLHEKYNFLYFLLRELDINSGNNNFDLTDKICASNFKQEKTGEYTDGTVESNGEIKAPTGLGVVLDTDKKQKLSEIIEEINEKYNKNFDQDVGVNATVQIRDLLLKNDKLKNSAKANKLSDFKFTYEEELNNELVKGYSQNKEFFEFLLNHPEEKDRIMGIYISDIYNRLNEKDEQLKVAEESAEYNSFESNVGRFKTNSGRNIYYYGEEFGDNTKSINNDNFTNIHTLNDLFAILLKSWKKETAYPSCQRDPQYNLDNDPTYGQCAITAIIVYDLFGGTIHRIRVNSGGTHYFNKINGHYIDLTRDQFDLYNIPVNYEPNETINREYCGKNSDTAKRLQMLQDNMKENQ